LASANPTNLLAVDMQELFEVQYSAKGSNKRCHEEAVIINWHNLQVCEGTVYLY